MYTRSGERASEREKKLYKVKELFSDVDMASDEIYQY